MTSRTSGLAGDNTSLSDLAGRYASALLDLADEKKALDQVSSDLQGLRSMVAASSDLRRLLSSPVITREEQRRAMAAVLDKAGIGAITRNFVLVVAQKPRLFALPAMIEAYLAELARRPGETAAQGTSARTD